MMNAELWVAAIAAFHSSFSIHHFLTMTPGDTITAISSAVGPASRMILRLNGPAAISIAQALSYSLPPAGGAIRTRLTFAGVQLPVWVYLFQSPRSYTGDDLVEFHIPGSPPLATLLLDELFRKGARLADPGEFTARAYFNGRLDLTEAEGVAATIAASNESELTAARRLMAGELTRRLAPITDLVANTLALIEVGIDFSDEDVSFLSAPEVTQRIAEADAALETLLKESNRFERLSHEPTVVLVGRPNAGKSALLNALAGRERAVVSPVAGTTRDVLSVDIPLRRGVVRLTDAAGIEPAEETAEAANASGAQIRINHLMRERALRAVESADLLLLIRDATDPRPQIELPREPDMVVYSKADLRSISQLANSEQLAVSALTGSGFSDLRAAIDRLAFDDNAAGRSLALNARHVKSIEESRQSLARAAKLVEAGAEFIAVELRESLDALGTITGRVTADDVLGRIFAGFCIGK